MNELASAILQTLGYADLFDYPLTAGEIYRYLIATSSFSTIEFEEQLAELLSQERLFREGDYYFLPERQSLTLVRRSRQIFSRQKIEKNLKVIAQISWLPWIKLVGLTGALAMENGQAEDDVDLMVVTTPARLWLSRLIVFLFLKLMGLKRDDRLKSRQGKICINLWCDEENLAVPEADRDLVVAHELAQMKPLVNKGGTYEKLIENNLWLKKYLVNWKI